MLLSVLSRELGSVVNYLTANSSALLAVDHALRVERVRTNKSRHRPYLLKNEGGRREIY